MDAILKRFETPDETRELVMGRFEIVHIGDMTIGRHLSAGLEVAGTRGAGNRRVALHG